MEELQIDWDFISLEEGGRKIRGYIPPVNKGTKEHSGVTIATGFDIGVRNEADLKKFNLPDELYQKLRPYLGKTKQNAKDFLGKNPLLITEEEAKFIDIKVKEVFTKKLVSWYEADVSEGSIKKFKDLPPAVQTIIASVWYQHGSFTKMVKYPKHILNNDYEMMIHELRNFGPYFKARRRREADYLERNLNKENSSEKKFHKIQTVPMDQLEMKPRPEGLMNEAQAKQPPTIDEILQREGLIISQNTPAEDNLLILQAYADACVNIVEAAQKKHQQASINI